MLLRAEDVLAQMSALYDALIGDHLVLSEWTAHWHTAYAWYIGCKDLLSQKGFSYSHMQLACTTHAIGLKDFSVSKGLMTGTMHIGCKNQKSGSEI